MKILLVCRDIHERGGISRYVHELATYLVEQHDVHLLASSYESAISGPVVHMKPAIKRPFWLDILSNAYFNDSYTKRLGRKHGFDIIHSQGAESRRCDVVTMHSCHKAAIAQLNKDNYEEDSTGEYLKYRIARYLRPLNRVVLSIEKRVVGNSTKIISVSQGVKRELMEYYNVPAEKIVVVCNGVDVQKFRPNPDARDQFRAEHGIERDTITMLFCAHEFRRKGLKYVIEALPRVKSPAVLLVAGRDNSVPYQKLAQDIGVGSKVRFLGSVAQGIEFLYAASDLVVFPTAYEAFSLVTLEAIASGVCLLTTKVNGTEDLIADGVNGLFIERNPEDIASKVNLLAGDAGLRAYIGENARNTAMQYTWRDVARRTVDVYEGVMATRE